MKISIVTPAYNAAQFLTKTIDSVLAQTMEDWELVIVDDGSADDTLSIAQAYTKDKRIRVVTKANGGVATARNFGYAHTSAVSEYVTLLDHDDLWKPETLQVLLDALTAKPDCVAVHGLARQTDIDGKPSGIPGGTIHSHIRRKPDGSRMATCSLEEPTTFAMLICHCYISTPGTSLIRRSALAAMLKTGDNLFSQEAAPADDWDFWLRLSSQGDIAYINEVVLDWRVHESNGSHDDTATFAAEWKVRRKMLDWPGLSPEQRKIAQYRYRRTYATALRHNIVQCRRCLGNSLQERKFGETARLVRQTAQCYAVYLIIRKFRGRLDRLPPAPTRSAAE